MKMRVLPVPAIDGWRVTGGRFERRGFPARDGGGADGDDAAARRFGLLMARAVSSLNS